MSMNARLSQDELQMLGEIGRCHLCSGIFLIKELKEAQVDAPEYWVYLCAACWEREVSR